MTVAYNWTIVLTPTLQNWLTTWVAIKYNVKLFIEWAWANQVPYPRPGKCNYIITTYLENFTATSFRKCNSRSWPVKNQKFASAYRKRYIARVDWNSLRQLLRQTVTAKQHYFKSTHCNFESVGMNVQFKLLFFIRRNIVWINSIQLVLHKWQFYAETEVIDAGHLLAMQLVQKRSTHHL